MTAKKNGSARRWRLRPPPAAIFVLFLLCAERGAMASTGLVHTRFLKGDAIATAAWSNLVTETCILYSGDPSCDGVRYYEATKRCEMGDIQDGAASGGGTMPVWRLDPKVVVKSALDPCPPDGFTLIGDKYFKKVDTKMNYDDAKANCESMGPGAHLATVRDESDAAIGTVYNDDQYWIGIRNVAEEACRSVADCIGKLAWDDGTGDVLTAEQVGRFTPDYDAGDACARIRATMKLWDRSCGVLFKSICQKACI